jgi:hypothetical protein
LFNFCLYRPALVLEGSQLTLVRGHRELGIFAFRLLAFEI